MQAVKDYLLIALLVATAVLGWFVWRDISDNRATVQSIRTELDNIGKSQQRIIGQLDSISKGLTESVERVESIEGTVTEVTDRNADSKERIDRSKQIISESKSILESIRSTGKETEKK